MKRLSSVFKNIIGTSKASPKGAFDKLSLDISFNDFGIPKQTPKLRLSVNQFKKDPILLDT